jgi:hypothetical protein
LGVNIGQQRKAKELVTWLRKKKRRVIRKDELITFLIGQNPNSKAPPQQLDQGQIPSTNSASSRRQNQLDMANSDLATFREALIMHSKYPTKMK